ncbi:unnamed protein product [Prunus armeniaca]|uniref:Uncharacterized protein n=1 Tax=Prunus armeniaca TaxID=36596 RepID=A0A6J5UST2_PRUAR|nr:unnamed protein product [Prunus armeniaca]
MAFKLSIFMLCVAALMLVLLQANQASTVETSALQQQENYQPYGTTQGSLRPQGIQGKFGRVGTEMVLSYSVLNRPLPSSLMSADRGALLGARPQRTRSLVCFSAKSVVQSACVFLLEHMETSKFALATTTGRPREEDQNAPN